MNDNPFELGRIAALNRKANKPPYSTHDRQYTRWLSGWQAGVREREQAEKAARLAAKQETVNA
jgi:hypothetical protein